MIARRAVTTVGAAVGVGALAGLRRRARGRTRQRQRHIQRLDAEADHEEIAFLLGAYEFPWDFEVALSLALLRTFGSPSISRLLDATAAFRAGPRKRYDDTELLLAEILEHGYDSDRGRAAIRRINHMHGAYDIAAEDMLYVMSTFVLEPVRWADRYGWRPLSAHERTAMFCYWRALGPRLRVRDIPATYAELEAFNRRYEQDRFSPAPSNRAVADVALDAVLSRLPRALRRSGRDAVAALLDPPARRAIGYRDPPSAIARTVDGVLRARARVLREFVPERRGPYLLTRQATPTYPSGYRIERLGTFPVDGDTSLATVARVAGRST